MTAYLNESKPFNLRDVWFVKGKIYLALSSSSKRKKKQVQE